MHDLSNISLARQAQNTSAVKAAGTARRSCTALAGIALALVLLPVHAADMSDRANRAMSSASATAAEAASAVSNMGRTDYTGVSNDRHWEHTHRASKIIGIDVRTRQGDKIGDIKDVVLDSAGSVAYAVVSTGGFLGIGDRLHAVPWSALDKRGDKDFVLDIDKAKLKSAPGFDSRHWPNFSDDQWVQNNRRYYRDWVEPK